MINYNNEFQEIKHKIKSMHIGGSVNIPAICLNFYGLDEFLDINDLLPSSDYMGYIANRSTDQIFKTVPGLNINSFCGYIPEPPKSVTHFMMHSNGSITLSITALTP